MARASRSPGCIAVWRRPSSPTFNAEAKNEAPFELGTGVINVPFAIPNIRIENPEAKAHTRIGWFRSVSNIPHAFAVQSSWLSWRRPPPPAATRRTNDYVVTRMTEAPRIVRVHIVPGDYRRGGARGAADSACTVQRNLRGDGQANPAAADRRPAESLTHVQ